MTAHLSINTNNNNHHHYEGSESHENLLGLLVNGCKSLSSSWINLIWFKQLVCFSLFVIALCMFVSITVFVYFCFLLDNHNNIDVETLKKKVKISQVITFTVPFTLFLGTFSFKIYGERGAFPHSLQQININK